MQQLNLILATEGFRKLEQLELWDIPQTTTKEQWAEGHKQLLLLQQVCRRLIPKSSAFGIKHFGMDFWVETEADFQLEFGLPIPDTTEIPKLEGEEAVIDYLERGFARWVQRSGDYETWDKPRLERALAMLEPLAEQADRIRQLLA
jgi:hypothetical protein